jgi:hypothetical protein
MAGLMPRHARPGMPPRVISWDDESSRHAVPCHAMANWGQAGGGAQPLQHARHVGAAAGQRHDQLPDDRLGAHHKRGRTAHPSRTARAASLMVRAAAQTWENGPIRTICPGF